MLCACVAFALPIVRAFAIGNRLISTQFCEPIRSDTRDGDVLASDVLQDRRCWPKWWSFSQSGFLHPTRTVLSLPPWTQSQQKGQEIFANISKSNHSFFLMQHLQVQILKRFFSLLTKKPCRTNLLWLNHFNYVRFLQLINLAKYLTNSLLFFTDLQICLMLKLTQLLWY